MPHWQQDTTPLLLISQASRQRLPIPSSLPLSTRPPNVSMIMWKPICTITRMCRKKKKKRVLPWTCASICWLMPPPMPPWKSWWTRWQATILQQQATAICKWTTLIKETLRCSVTTLSTRECISSACRKWFAKILHWSPAVQSPSQVTHIRPIWIFRRFIR